MLMTRLCVLLGLLGTAVLAHDIPSDVNVQVFLRPEGNTLHLLVRAPLKAMRDVDIPKVGPGYLDLARAEGALRHGASTWIADSIAIFENDQRLTNPRLVEVRASLESDKSFAEYSRALEHATGPRLPNETNVPWDQVLLDALIEYTIPSDRARFSISPGLDRLGLRVITNLRFIPADGPPRSYEFNGDPGQFSFDPSWSETAGRFLRLGFFQVLDRPDYLLLLLCLVIPFRRTPSLTVVTVPFAIAQLITLFAHTYDLGPDALWFPPLIETLLAAAIVYMAIENIIGSKNVNRRWMLGFAFGLVHGFSFSLALRSTLQFAGSNVFGPLTLFGAGIELAQLLMLVLMIPVLELSFRYVAPERVGGIILSAIVAHPAWHWMVDRGSVLRQFPWRIQRFDAAFAASVIRGLMWAVVLGGLVWLTSIVLRSRQEREAQRQAQRQA
jgi:hypothetical protein